MNETEFHQSEQSKKKIFNTIDYLTQFSMSREELKKFEKERVLPESLDIWNSISEEEKIRIAAIDKLSNEELAKLIEAPAQEKPAFTHTNPSQLQFLYALTGDEKYLIKNGPKTS